MSRNSRSHFPPVTVDAYLWDAGTPHAQPGIRLTSSARSWMFIPAEQIGDVLTDINRLLIAATKDPA